MADDGVYGMPKRPLKPGFRRAALWRLCRVNLRMASFLPIPCAAGHSQTVYTVVFSNTILQYLIISRMQYDAIMTPLGGGGCGWCPFWSGHPPPWKWYLGLVEVAPRLAILGTVDGQLLSTWTPRLRQHRVFTSAVSLHVFASPWSLGGQSTIGNGQFMTILISNSKVIYVLICLDSIFQKDL